MGGRVQDILQGKRPCSDLVVLDDEFSPASGQLWEFAIIEYLSGETLINITVKHPNDVDHGALLDHYFMRYLSQVKARPVYASSRRSHITHMDVHEIASALQQAGISQDTIILVYHQAAVDLRILRQFLAGGGYTEILPSDENRIPLINLRPNIFSHNS